MGELLPCAGKTQEKKQCPDGSRTWWCGLLQSQDWPCHSSQEARNHSWSARRVMDCSHRDGLAPKLRMAGCAPSGIFLHVPQPGLRGGFADLACKCARCNESTETWLQTSKFLTFPVYGMQSNYFFHCNFAFLIW